MGRKVLVASRGPKIASEGKEGKHSGAKRNLKGARWAKGHSCVSNPSVTKHREQVSSTFLHPVNAGKSLLTAKNLNNRHCSWGVDSKEEDNDTFLSSDVASLTISDSPMSILTSASSIRTIASGWSQVSHDAFQKFLRKFNGNIVAHKDMLSILGAASEVIREAGGKQNETEFFATFMSLLNTCPADQYQPLMSLVCIIIGKVSPGVLKLRFEDIYPRIVAIQSHAVENDDDLLMRTSIEAFTKLLKVQDTLNFAENKGLETAFYGLLKFGLSDKPKVRRKVRQCVKTLIVAFNDKSSKMIPKLLFGWILDQLSCFPVCSPRVVTNAITLLATSWNLIPKISYIGAKTLFESVLRVMSGTDSSIMKIGLSFFVVVFQNEVIISNLDLETTEKFLTNKLLIALWELKPDWRNVDTFVLWLTTIFLGIVRSREESETQTSQSYLPLLFESVNSVWLTSYGKRVLTVFNEYLPQVITTDIKAEDLDLCFQTLGKNYLIIPPNPLILKVTECVLDQLTPANFTSSAKEVFFQLTPLSTNSGVMQVLGKFVKAFGVEVLWGCADQMTCWDVILPLLNENLSDSNISFWKKEMLSSIGKFGTPQSIWLAFLGFCRNPKDPQNFPAALVGKVINEKPDLRLSALASLRQFIEWPHCLEVAVKYSKNFLPVLFNLYVQEKKSADHPGHADAIGVTIQKYLTVCEDLFINQLVEKAFSKLEGCEEEDFSSILDLIAFLSFNVKNNDLLNKVLELVSNKFCIVGQRKRIYRIMTFAAKNNSISRENLHDIYKKLMNSKGEAKTNAAALRMECINIVTEKDPQWLKSFLSEVILNLISANAKAKRCAVAYVSRYFESLKREGKSGDEIVGVVVSALGSTSSLLVSSATFFIFLAYKELQPPSPNFEVLNIIFENLKRFEDPVVLKYSLAFINVNLSLYKGQMGQIATSIGQVAGDSKYPRKEINKLLARMIKTFGSAGLRAVLPNADDPKMRTRVKNICKKIRKMKEEEKKAAAVQDDDKDESDGEYENEFGQINENRKQMVIKEGLVDFLNPKEITQALVSELSTKTDVPDDSEFKTTKDGMLIIGNVEDDNVSDSESDMDLDEIRMSRKRKSTTASIASSKKSARSSKTSVSFKSSKKRKPDVGNRSVILPKRKKSSSVKFSSSIVRFK